MSKIKIEKAGDAGVRRERIGSRKWLKAMAEQEGGLTWSVVQWNAAYMCFVVMAGDKTVASLTVDEDGDPVCESGARIESGRRTGYTFSEILWGDLCDWIVDNEAEIRAAYDSDDDDEHKILGRVPE